MRQHLCCLQREVGDDRAGEVALGTGTRRDSHRYYVKDILLSHAPCWLT